MNREIYEENLKIIIGIHQLNWNEKISYVIYMANIDIKEVVNCMLLKVFNLNIAFPFCSFVDTKAGDFFLKNLQRSKT